MYFIAMVQHPFLFQYMFHLTLDDLGLILAMHASYSI